ncbi:MAG: hypothetical protein OEM02_01410 [Desulfobulbaceae bacterium]|nr:hypothetical protein [Desulfobulbaceae bacterium]
MVKTRCWTIVCLCRVVAGFTALVVLMLQPGNGLAQGSVLGRFEQEVQKKDNEQVEEDVYSSDEYFDTEYDSGLDDLWLALFIGGGYGVINSVERVSTSLEDSDIALRRDGEPLLPYAAFDFTYQVVEQDVHANGYRFELGYGPVALQYRHTAYREDEPSDELDFRQVNALLRMSFGDVLECDLGFGVLTMDGEDSYSGFLWSFPILFHPIDYLGFELRPSWAIINDNTINEFDASLLVGQRYVFVRVGYRWVKTGDVTLEGGYLGLSLRY